MTTQREPAAIPGTNVLRWELGNALRDHRRDAGMTISQAAEALECSEAKISRLETGQRGAVPRDVRDLCAAYRVPEQRAAELQELSRQARSADRANSRSIPAKFSTYLALESTATSIRWYESTFVPALLQADEYMRTIMVDQGRFTEAEMAERIAIRLDRQRRLTDPASPVRVHFVIDENVLWRPIGDAAAREHQLERLVWASRLPNVTLQVMPYDVGAYPGMEGSTVVLLGFEEDARQSTTCYLEGMLMELFIRGQSEIDAISDTFQILTEKALGVAESRALLMRIAGGRYRHWSVAGDGPRRSGPGHQLSGGTGPPR
jgi:transcriptional regulator with XRE-family HTH domain